MKKSVMMAVMAIAVVASGMARAERVKAGLPGFLTGPGEKTGRKSVMFVFGHFDDDSVISGTMNMYVRAGWKVSEVWVVTAGMGEGSMWGSTTLRKAEMMRVADIQGIKPEDRYPLPFGDREAFKHLPEICDRVTELVKKYQPSVMITCAYEGGHWDHDASGLAAYVASRRVDFPIERFEIPTYNSSGPKVMPFRINGFIKSYGPHEWVMPDKEGWKVRKRERYAYQSQWFLMWPEGLIFGWRHLRGQGEPIRRAPEYNYLEPPHPGPEMVLRKHVGALRWETFAAWQDAVRTIPEFLNK
jgi:LmbE family N-acetylglucosaminyl deacetylase